MTVVTFLYLNMSKMMGNPNEKKKKKIKCTTHSTKLSLGISSVISSTKLNYPGDKGGSHIDIKSFKLIVCFSSV